MNKVFNFDLGTEENEFYNNNKSSMLKEFGTTNPLLS